MSIQTSKSQDVIEGKGKQKIEAKTDEEKAKYAPEKLRADAFAYLTQLVEQYPNSKFNIEYDYNKPADYEETDDVITGDEINQSLSNLNNQQ